MSSGKPETRRAILEAAQRLFVERGPSAVRMVDIAKSAGVTRQAVYLHFGSRTNLLVALVQYVDEVNDLAELSRPVWEAPTAAEALSRLVSLNAVYNPRIYPIVKALMSNRYADEAIAAAWDDRMQSRWDACQGLILRLKEEGILRVDDDLDRATDLLWTLTSHQVWEQLVIDQGWPAARYEEYLSAVLQQTFVVDDE
ncbi:MAG: TetR/AcrR family transcriptional regulator [Chloroflexota bacterium]